MCFTSDGASCHGDSGGGMFILRGKSQELIGVCSYGLSDCDNWAPEVYTKVSFVLRWIEETIKNFDTDDINMEQCGITILDEENNNKRRRRSWPVLDWLLSKT